MTALAYEPFVFAGRPSAWLIERYPCDSNTGRRIAEAKQLVAEGWDVSLLLAPDASHLILVGCRYGWNPEAA